MDKFKFVVPASLSKSDDGQWVVAGLASTNNIDQQGEIIDQSGMDLSPIDQGKGWFNWDHQPGISNLLGTLDSYQKTGRGLFVKGRLFKNKQMAKDVYDVMSSLDKSDTGRIGMSVEGKILERCTDNPKIIKKCRINKIALTLNPVNSDTYADLVKSLNVENNNLVKSIVNSDIEFNAIEGNYAEKNYTDSDPPQLPIFTADQVVEIVKKALGVGAGYTQAPTNLSGGDALATSDLDKGGAGSGKRGHNTTIDQVANYNRNKPTIQEIERDDPVYAAELKRRAEKRKRKLKKGSTEFFTKGMTVTLDKLQILYPDNSRSELWEALKDRLSTKYPEFEKAGIRLKQVDAKEREHKLYEDARQRSDYDENKTKNRAQLAEIAREAGTGKKEQAQIRAQRDASIQAGEDREHVRPGVED